MAKKNEFTMEMETRAFNSALNNFIRKSNLSVNIILKKVAFDLLNNIIGNKRGSKHPVDTGRARAGWYASMVGLGLGFDLSSGVKDPLKSDVSRGKKEGSYKENFSGFDKYIELINGVDYIIYLEYGHSKKQAPYGMVRISMRKMRGVMPKELNEEFRKQWNKEI